ncbi:rhomboid family intramembrane serine protease [Marinigracilibium pacificum]|uniref:Rhomboid family intramembrane serine protease n=1 Tax=Marinigracilibium pacificum TaxID=2729599 RepID=A0A848IXS6_9BACT|nr:rhomboid family intramembrane serine protease [Marinigracilibium pacificum]NMM49323.1 rhomboid family intramembrane serine protease [Marinigracilibium pacificum]
MKDQVALRLSAIYAVLFVTLLWGVKALELSMNISLGFLGVFPGNGKGMLGIFTGPLVHGNFDHLISNSLPLLVLITGTFFFYRKVAIHVFIVVYVLSGFLVWLFAREAYHIGSSGIVYGLVFFLFFSGLFRREYRSLIISSAVFLLYGTTFPGILPGDPFISFESHLAGAFSGLIGAYIYKDQPLFGIPNITDEANIEKEKPTGVVDSPNYTCNHSGTEKDEINYYFKEKEIE